MPTTAVEQHKKWTTAEKIALAKKHAIKPDVIKGLQELFKDAPPAEEIIKMIKK